MSNIESILAKIPDEVIIDYQDPQVVARAMQWNFELYRLPSFFKLIDGVEQVGPSSFKFVRDRCYLWQGSHKNGGKGRQHGEFGILRTGCMKSHRIMYILYQGIPLDPPEFKDNLRKPCPCGAFSDRHGHVKAYVQCCRLQTRHLCLDVTHQDHDGLCVNPLHMTLGTQQDNMNDMARHGTAHRMYGSESHEAKIDEDQALAFLRDYEMRLQQDPSTTIIGVAKDHGITDHIGRHIVQGRAWNHVTGKPRPPKDAWEQKKALKKPVVEDFVHDYNQSIRTETLVDIVKRHPDIGSEGMGRLIVNGQAWQEFTGIAPKTTETPSETEEEKMQRVHEMCRDWEKRKGTISMRKLAIEHGFKYAIAYAYFTGHARSSQTGIAPKPTKTATKKRKNASVRKGTAVRFAEYMRENPTTDLEEAAALFDITKENAKAIMKGRIFSQSTGIAPMAKLERKVPLEEMKQRVALFWQAYQTKKDSESIRSLSKKFAISSSMANSIVNGKAWTNVTGLPNRRPSTKKCKTS